MDLSIGKKAFLYLALLAIVVCICFYFIQLDLKQKVALFGSGPQAYVHFENRPQNFEKDWNFQFKSAQNFMLATKLYIYLQKYLDIRPSQLMSVQVLVQIILIVFGSAYLSFVLFENHTVAAVSAIFVTVTDIMNLNLSRHGPSIDIPAYSGIPNGLTLFAICFFLQNRFFLYFLFSLLTAYFYINLGFILSIFTLSYLLVKPSLIKEAKFFPYFLIYILLLSPNVYSILYTSDVLENSIPAERWVQLAKIFSVHWFPSTLDSFYPHYLTPFIALSVLFLISLKYINYTSEMHIKIYTGFVSIALLSAISILITEYFPIPIIVKLSFQKSTMLVSVIGSLYVINYLYRKIMFGNTPISMLALSIIVLPFFSMFGWSVFGIFLLVISETAPVSILSCRRT